MGGREAAGSREPAPVGVVAAHLAGAPDGEPERALVVDGQAVGHALVGVEVDEHGAGAEAPGVGIPRVAGHGPGDAVGVVGVRPSGLQSMPLDMPTPATSWLTGPVVVDEVERTRRRLIGGRRADDEAARAVAPAVVALRRELGLERHPGLRVSLPRRPAWPRRSGCRAGSRHRRRGRRTRAARRCRGARPSRQRAAPEPTGRDVDAVEDVVGRRRRPGTRQRSRRGERGHPRPHLTCLTMRQPLRRAVGTGPGDADVWSPRRPAPSVPSSIDPRWIQTPS